MIARRALPIIALAFFAAPGWAKSYHIGRVSITAQVRSDGSMHVREVRGYVFSGSFHHAYRTVPLPAGAQIRDFAVSEAGASYAESAGESPGSYRTSREGDVFRADWYCQASDETRTFALDYDVIGAAQKHADFAELYWQFVGREWGVRTDSVAVTVTLPGAAPRGEIRAWAHGPLWGEIVIGDGQVDFVCDRLPPKTMVEGRVLFPAGLIASSLAVTARSFFPRCWRKRAASHGPPTSRACARR